MELATLDGKRYKKVTILENKPTHLEIMHEFGVSKIFFTNLSKQIQKKYHYSKEEAVKFIVNNTKKAQELAKRKLDKLAEIQTKNEIKIKKLAEKKAMLLAEEKEKIQIVANFSEMGEKWKIIVISKKLSNSEIITLAKKLHEKNPNIHYEMFDDDKEIDVYIAYRKHPNNRSYKYPYLWVQKHDKGMINKMLGSWQLYHTFNGKISDL